MMRYLLLVLAITMAPHARGAEVRQAVVLAIENMTCALCPTTVRAAIRRVDGVSEVTVDFRKRTATVLFDPARTGVAAIAAASRSAGFPAEPAS